MLSNLAKTAQSVAIQYVGGATVNLSSPTSTISFPTLSGGLASSPSANDVVIIYYQVTRTSDPLLDITGYAKETYIRSSGSGGTTNLFVGSKTMGATPDTTIAFVGAGSSGNGPCAAIQVWRNVDPYYSVSQIVTSSSTSTILCNPPSITPTVVGSVIVAGGGGSSSVNSTATYSSSDLTNFISIGSNSTSNSVVGLGYKTWTSGAFDPAAFTYGASDSTTYANAAVTLTLYPKQNKTPPSFIASAQTQNSATGSSLVISKPTGTAQNDLMIAFMGLGSSASATWTGDTGWTEIADQGASPDLRIAYKIAGASEGSSYTFTASTSSATLSGVILTYRNAAYDIIGSIQTGANPSAPSITVSSDFSRLLGFCVQNSTNNMTTTIKTVRAIDSDSTTPNWIIGDEIVLAGSTGTRSFAATQCSAILMAIKPT